MRKAHYLIRVNTDNYGAVSKHLSNKGLTWVLLTHDYANGSPTVLIDAYMDREDELVFKLSVSDAICFLTNN